VPGCGFAEPVPGCGFAEPVPATATATADPGLPLGGGADGLLDDTITPTPRADADREGHRAPCTAGGATTGAFSAGMIYAEPRAGTGGGGKPRAVDIALRVAAASRNHRAKRMPCGSASRHITPAPIIA